MTTERSLEELLQQTLDDLEYDIEYYRQARNSLLASYEEQARKVNKMWAAIETLRKRQRIIETALEGLRRNVVEKDVVR